MTTHEEKQEAIQQIYDKHGKVTTTLVLDAAGDPGSPLHDHFEWDDTEAGHRYRLIQSRNLIRTVRIVYNDEPERLVNVPSLRRASVVLTKSHALLFRGTGVP